MIISIKGELKMEDYKKRVINERADLFEKIIALEKFFLTETFKNLDFEEKSLMRMQSMIMSKYSEILAERIGNF